MSGWDDDEQTTKNVDVDRAQHDDDRREERRDERGASESHHTNHNETTVAHAPNAGNNIYVTNLSPKTTDESLREHFSPFGELVHCQCVKDPQTSQNRGFAFVAYKSVDDSDRAIEALNNSDLDGRPIKVERAKRGGGYDKTPGRYLGPRQNQIFSGGRGGGGYERRDGGYQDYREAPRGGGGGGYRESGGYSDYRDRDRDFVRPRDDYEYPPPRREPLRAPPAYDRREGAWEPPARGIRPIGGYDEVYPPAPAYGRREDRGARAYAGGYDAAPGYDRGRTAPAPYRGDDRRDEPYGRGPPPPRHGSRY